MAGTNRIHQYRLQRLVVALARWNARHDAGVWSLEHALDGRAMPKVSLLSMVDTSDVTLNTAAWWPTDDDSSDVGSA